MRQQASVGLVGEEAEAAIGENGNSAMQMAIADSLSHELGEEVDPNTVHVQEPERAVEVDVALAIEDDGTDYAGGGCVSHDSCDELNYCDTFNNCYTCTMCSTYNDAVDGTCPSKCEDSSSVSSSSSSQEEYFYDYSDANMYGCSSHESCDLLNYCDTAANCYPCEYCDYYMDAFDGVCPDKCSSDAVVGMDSSSSSTSSDWSDSSDSYYSSSSSSSSWWSSSSVSDGSCNAHADCSGWNYCDYWNNCYTCELCEYYQDAIDGACPAKCLSDYVAPAEYPSYAGSDVGSDYGAPNYADSVGYSLQQAIAEDLGVPLSSVSVSSQGATSKKHRRRQLLKSQLDFKVTVTDAESLTCMDDQKALAARLTSDLEDGGRVQAALQNKGVPVAAIDKPSGEAKPLVVVPFDVAVPPAEDPEEESVAVARATERMAVRPTLQRSLEKQSIYVATEAVSKAEPIMAPPYPPSPPPKPVLPPPPPPPGLPQMPPLPEGQACEYLTELRGPKGRFTDGTAKDSPYVGGARCSWIIDPGLGTTVKLIFTRFRTEEGFDTVRVYDGKTTSSAILGEFSGSQLPNLGRPIASSGEYLLVEFMSDGSSGSTGFEALWLANHSSNAALLATHPSKDPCTEGGMELRGSHGSFDDSSLAHANYLNARHCMWHVVATGAPRVAIRFNRFDTEPLADFVRIYAGEPMQGNLIAELTGHVVPSTAVFVVPHASATVVFTTDTVGVRSGWAAEWEATTDEPGACQGGTTLRAKEGTFGLSKTGRDFAPSSLSCSWLVAPRNTPNVRLAFHPDKTDLHHGFLRVLGIPHSGGDEILLWNSLGGSGAAPPAALVMAEGSIRVEYAGPISVAALESGLADLFEAEYGRASEEEVAAAKVVAHTCTDSMLNGLEEGVDCGGPECRACEGSCFGTKLVSVPDGRVTVTDGSAADAGYDGDRHCRWLFTAEEENRVLELQFTRFDTEESKDVVKVFDGFQASGGAGDQENKLLELAGELTADELSRFKAESSERHLLVEFRSDGAIGGDGFEMEVRTCKGQCGSPSHLLSSIAFMSSAALALVAVILVTVAFQLYRTAKLRGKDKRFFAFVEEHITAFFEEKGALARAEESGDAGEEAATLLEGHDIEVQMINPASSPAPTPVKAQPPHK